MKKKLLECEKHGSALFRCKRRSWHYKKDEWVTDYKEQCFKCIAEGRYLKTTKLIAPKKKHIKI